MRHAVFAICFTMLGSGNLAAQATPASDDDLALALAMHDDDPLELHTCCSQNSKTCDADWDPEEGICDENDDGKCSKSASCVKLVERQMEDDCLISVVDTHVCDVDDATGEDAWCLKIDLTPDCWTEQFQWEEEGSPDFFCRCGWGFGYDPPPRWQYRGTRKICDPASDNCLD